ncbi:4-alpha-glucanotransferase [Niabella ginsengisoli]|uniref:4-alpha-glucanotransferase n=1 Tax=Niabella ginsengisoli TaxID=522298 RepID=A0ABS9SS01_9BACT|nr:4-alpha-glucanotransferase [Niabella ginsengisoli]MCH5600919.1 4-alpha-glucanotransferase [Niabella ginsengisoli]
MQDGFVNMQGETWRGGGVAIPVFSLRSKNGFGVGEFSDLKLLTDWAVKTKLKLIQILPVNDTTATNTWLDSYPYAAISAFALHPIYINIDEIDGKKNKELKEAIKTKRKQLNELAHVDYEAVMKFKMAVLRESFEERAATFQKSHSYKDFFEKNKSWLKPYAAYSYLRDKYLSPNPSDWQTNKIYNEKEINEFFEDNNPANKQVLYYCYVQYQLHLQLSDAVEYARKKGVIVKGDIPIGVYRFGCDAWVAPDLYKMEVQAGAPPDDFAVKGQNWGFPTYNWQKMKDGGFAWWRERFEQMSHYFDAFRIDHILGFFRIWSIPLHAIQGIMGKFDPCLPIHINEFGEQGIWFDYERFCMPYITDDVLIEIFQEQSENVKRNFYRSTARDNTYCFHNLTHRKKLNPIFIKSKIATVLSCAMACSI